MVARGLWVLLGSVCFLNAAQAFPTGGNAAPMLERWIERLEQRIKAAEATGLVRADEKAKFRAGLEQVRRMRSAAIADGMVTENERNAIHQVIGMLDMEIAEIRFTNRDERLAETPKPTWTAPKPKLPEPGAATVIPAF